MDKYYMLIRRFVNATFRLLMRYDWDSSGFQTYNDILTTKGGPLWYSVHCLLLCSVLA
jgi:ribosomal RNA-processing protein 1